MSIGEDDMNKISELERIEYTNAYMKDICGIRITNDDLASNEAIHLLKTLNENNISVDEIISNKMPDHPQEMFVTLKDISQCRLGFDHLGEQIKLVELFIEGTGIARSYENLCKLYTELENNEVNILGQICTDLKLRLYLSPDDREGAIIALSRLGIAF